MGNTQGNSGEGIEWNQQKNREYFDKCFEVYDHFHKMSDQLEFALNDFVNDETHTGPEADSAKDFVNSWQMILVQEATYCLQLLQGMMQGPGFENGVPLLEDFIADVSENEDAVIKSIHIDKIIEDFAGYNTVFKEVHPEVKRIHDDVEAAVKDCDVVSRKSYTDPNPDGANEAFDAFTSEDKTTGHVPEFKDKFIAFCDEHSNDIEGSTFKSVLDGIVQNLNNIIDGMQKGTLDITRFNETKSNIKWLDPEDMVSPEDADAFLKYLKTYELYLKGLVDRCQVYKYDPVNMSSGNYINDRIDLTVGTKDKLIFRRFYNARSDFKGMLGNGWSCKGDVRLRKEENGDIKATSFDGRECLYKKKEDTDVYIEIHGEDARLLEEETGYKLIRGDQSYEEYDKAGYLIAEGDNTGEQIRITYKDTLPVRMECKDGTYIDLSYNEDKILTRITDSERRSVSYRYEVREEVGKREYYLTDATYPGGSVRRYIYNEAGLIKSVISPDGVVALTNEYDEKRRVIHQMFPDGGEMSYSYDDEKHVTTATEQNGLKVEYLSDEKGRHIGTRYVGLTKDHTRQDLSDDKNIIEEKYTYNKRNQKTSVTDKNGYTTRYSYDNKGHLTKIVGPEGLNESYTYDADGRLLSKKDSEGNTYKYIYDLEGNLYSVTDPEGNRTKYDYEDGKVTCMRDAEGNETLLVYDEKGNISSITDASGITTRYVCDDRGRVEKTIDPEGNETSYAFDENDNLTSVTDPLGNTTRYAYNAAGLLTQMMNPDGSVKTWAYNEIGKPSFYTDENDHTTKIDYNTSWKEESITLPNGGQINYAYDLLGNMINVTDPEGRKTVYTHDNEGNVLTVGTEDENKEVTTKTSYTYDKLGRIDAETDGEGNTTTYRYDRNGNLTCMIDALGGKTSYEYDSLQRVTKITDAIGRTTLYTYDKNGNIETVTDPAKVVTTNHYEMGRLIKVTQKAEGTEERTIKAYEYDVCGRISKQIEIDGFETCYSYDKAGRVNKVTGANGRDIEYVYDQMGRAVEVIDCGTKTFYTYTGTGKLRSVTDALGNETRYTYNELDLLSKIERVGEGSEPHVTTFEHDLSGNLINEIDALSQKTSYTYDAAGDIKSLTDRDGNETVYTRDKNGNITGIKYSDGNEVLYKYNALNILKEVQEKIGLTKIESDILGRTIKVTDPNGETVGYEYGPRDERTAVIYPDGKRAEYEFDAFGKLISLKDVNGSEDTVRYNYNDNGLLTDKIFPNGTSTSYDYYPGGLLKSLTSSDKDGVLDKYEYTYNEKGNRTQIKRERRDLLNVSGIYSYSYDELGRLSETRKDNALQSTYSYDAFGNRIEEISEGVKTTYSYDILDRLISKTEFKTSGNNTSTYAYDNRGNLTREYENDTLTRTYDYNRQGMLERTVLDPTSELKKEISYTYNFVNQRTSKKSGLEEIKYLTDITRDHSNLLKETENGKVKTYTYDEQVVSFNSDGINTYYQTDELGSTMYLTGTDGAAYSPYAYDPFGNRIDPKTGRKANKHGYTKEGNIIQPFAFTGYREEESGLYYAQARSYDPRTGRFTGEDKVRGFIAIPDTINHYGYCLNNPLIYIDANGCWITVAIGAIAGAVIGGVSYAVGAAIKGEEFDVVKCVASAAGGAAVGGLMGAGVTNPTVLGAAGGAASGYVNGVAQAAKDVKASIDRGDSIGQVALTCAKGWLTVNESTFKGGLYGGALGTAFSLGGPVGGTIGALSFSAVSGGIEGYKKEKQAVKNDPNKDSIDWGNVARYAVGQTVETGIGILGFGALNYGFSKAGVYDTENVNTTEEPCTGENGSAKTPEDIFSDLPETTNGKGVARNFESSGGYDQAVQDFNSLNPTNVKDIQTQYGPGKVGTLSDGTRVVVRPGSKTGGPTLEITVSNSKVYKIRY